ncbi:MAG: SCP2 sterol-binding domain-containing protein [Flavobacteriales bacterium]|nr:SCP2 sterol-binding domain-containing protein [Flavobacteriales bacterium]
MSFETTLKAVQEKAASAKPLGNSLKFHFGDKNITIDGKGDTNEVHEDHGEEVDCTVDVELADLLAMLSGELNPMNAFMAGKLKVKGDMSVAMKLGTIMG